MQFLKSKIATVILACLLAVVSFTTVRLLAQKYQFDKQVADLQARADRIKGDNQQLSDLVKYLNTPQYQEKAAREKLDLKKDGEVVVGLPKDQTETTTTQTQDTRSNPKKWFDYFFKKS
jgi:cell division protein FtsB